MTYLIKLPSELNEPYFFPEEIFKLYEHALQKFHPNKPFIYEACYYTGRSVFQPWKKPEEVIPLLLQEWENVKVQIRQLFNNRNVKEVQLPMKHAISLYIEFLYWTNGVPVRFPLNHDALKTKPVNSQERLDFIIARPTLHHSYIQLSELIVEQEKRYVKIILINQKG